MKKSSLLTLLVFAAIIGLYYLVLAATAPLPTGKDDRPLHPEDEPLQVETTLDPPGMMKLDKGEVEITPQAKYKIAARLCGLETYRSGWASQLAPYDACLAWGRLTEKEVNRHVSYSQSDRWYRFRVDGESPVTVEYTARHSANTHLIFTDDLLRRAAGRLDEGDIVELTGYLVAITGNYKKGSVWWNSSLTREDSGNGSCEVLWVQSLRVGEKVFGKPLAFD